MIFFIKKRYDKSPKSRINMQENVTRDREFCKLIYRVYLPEFGRTCNTNKRCGIIIDQVFNRPDIDLEFTVQ